MFLLLNRDTFLNVDAREGSLLHMEKYIFRMYFRISAIATVLSLYAQCNNEAAKVSILNVFVVPTNTGAELVRAILTLF